MSEFLTVRLSRAKQAPIQWAVWSTSQNEIIVSGMLDSKELLGKLTSYAHQRTTLVLIDSREVILMKADIPAGAARQIENVLPYLLEDDIAQDAEELHLSIQKKSSARVQIAGIDKEYLSEWLQAFKEADIEVKKVVPDVLALPLLEGGISAVNIDSQWLFRKSYFQSLSIKEEWLDTLYQSDWFDSNDEQPVITSYSDIPKISSDKVTWKMAAESEPVLAMELLTKGAMASSVNLLTGSFKPKSPIFKNLKVWRSALSALGLFLVIFTAQKVSQTYQYEQQASVYRAESERIFRSIFPDKQRIPTVSYLKRQMTDEKERLSVGGQSSKSVLDWLIHLPEGVKKQPSLEIQSIRYDAKREEIRIEVSMGDFQVFEIVRAQLLERFSVEQGPLNRQNNKVLGSFVLRKK